MMIPVSAIVTAHREGELLKECIESIQNQTYPVEELIIIVDQGEQETLDVAMATGAKVYQVMYGNTYLAKRAGLQAAQYNAILSVDADTTLAGDFLERGIKHLETYDAATGHVYSRERTLMGDIAGAVSNILPGVVYLSGPGYVLNRMAYQETCKIRRVGEDLYIDHCTEEREIPLQRLDAIKDPQMRMWTILPSQGQRRMIIGARVVGGLFTVLRVLA